MKRYLERRLDTARAEGGEGLIAELVRVEKEGGRISPREMVAMVFLLLGAGSETTTHLIGGSVFELLRKPELRDWLKQDWEPPDLAVEEFLRFVSPVQFSKPRFVRTRRRSRRRDIAARARGSWSCWRPPTWTRRRTSNPNGSTSGGRPTIIFRSEPAFTSVSAISSRASKRDAPSGRCSSAGRTCNWALPEEQIRWRERPGLRALASLPVEASD